MEAGTKTETKIQDFVNLMKTNMKQPTKNTDLYVLLMWSMPDVCSLSVVNSIEVTILVLALWSCAVVLYVHVYCHS